MSKFYIGNKLAVDPDIKLEKIELTQAEYDALTTKEDNVLYLITDAVNPLEELSNMLDQHLQNNSDGFNHIPSGGAENQILTYESDGKAKWSNLADLLFQMKDLVSYGVSWKPDVADPQLTRVGNMTYHKTLPIQSQMRLCIYDAIAKKVVYWLDEDDCRFAAHRKNLPLYKKLEQEGQFSTVQVSIESPGFGDLPDTPMLMLTNFSGVNSLPQYGRPVNPEYKDVVCELTAVYEGSQKYEWKYYYCPIGDENRFENWISSSLTGQDDLLLWEFGAFYDGTDGEVMVYIPEFYIKSWDDSSRREVRISTAKLDDTWERQPPMYVGAFRDTILLNKDHIFDGYLDKVQEGAAVTVANTHESLRGGSHVTSDSNSDDIVISSLGKPRTNVNREQFRTAARKSGKEILSYTQYKNIYWLYTIEYANFNSQDSYTDELTVEGFHQGGLGSGLTNINDWGINSYNPLCPNGYCLIINGKHTGTTRLWAPSISGQDPIFATKWRGIENPFGDIWTNLDGIVIQMNADDISNGVNGVYITDNPDNYGDDITVMTRAGSQVLEDEYIKEWDLGHAAHIIPRSVGGDTTQYKCDYNCAIIDQDVPHTLLVGGGGWGGSGAGLGAFLSCDGGSATASDVGFRSVSSVS